MNLMDIFTKMWSEPCLKATAPQLEEKLGNPTPPTAVLVLHFSLVLFYYYYCYYDYDYYYYFTVLVNV